MRLGRERPRKIEAGADYTWADLGFNEAGARTPQKGQHAAKASAAAPALQ